MYEANVCRYLTRSVAIGLGVFGFMRKSSNGVWCKTCATLNPVRVCFLIGSLAIGLTSQNQIHGICNAAG